MLANLEKDLKAAFAADPDLKGVSKDDLAAWVAADVDEAFAAMAKPSCHSPSVWLRPVRWGAGYAALSRPRNVRSSGCR
ncbi:hypothetical protein ACIRG5_47855 [Lentzea sp. NPDC102401]|uniref:hypothetical protein n=1 Tax=Lentzea sp. NPDC102401 TaxID=3364128 RepID=UPI0037FB0583